jgi:hypothetical protein
MKSSTICTFDQIKKWGGRRHGRDEKWVQSFGQKTWREEHTEVLGADWRMMINRFFEKSGADCQPEQLNRRYTHTLINHTFTRLNFGHDFTGRSENLKNVKLHKLWSHQVLRHSFPCWAILWDINSCVYGRDDASQRGLKFQSRFILVETGLDVHYYVVQWQAGRVREEQLFNDVNCFPTHTHTHTHKERR